MTEVKLYFRDTKFESWVNPLVALILYAEGKGDILEVRGDEKEAVEKLISIIDDLKNNSPSEELKNMIQAQNARFRSQYWELRDKFDHLQGLIYQAIIDLCERHGAAVPYDKIVEYVKMKHPDIKVETITRRVRELKEQGMLIEPSRGKFYIKTLVKEVGVDD